MLSARKLIVAVVIFATTNAALATSYIYKPLKLPKAEDIAAFANGIEDSSPRVQVPRERILRFLAMGKSNTAPETWPKLEELGPAAPATMDGVFTDKVGKVYFWTLHSSKVLTIISAEHEQALIQLGK